MLSRRILLVDDSPEFLRSAEHFLSAAPGLEVVGRAPSGKEALKQVDRLQPDLVLMDIAMPNMNGLEATRQIKADPAAPQVVLVTMHDSPEYRAAAAAAGADGFVAKPEFGARLLPLIRSLFDEATVEIRRGAEATREAPKQTARILVVQDRLTNRRFLITLLQSAGYQMSEAGDAFEAMQLLRAERPDLLLTGILLPGMDGFELARGIRRDPSIADTRVVFCTDGYNPEATRLLAEACGVLHMLSESSDSEAILGAVQDALRSPCGRPASLTDAEFDHFHRRLVHDALCEKTLELEQAHQRLAVLVELGQQLAQETDPECLLDNFCHAARHVLAARFAFLGLRGNDGQIVQPYRTSGLDRELAARIGLETAGPGLLRRLLAEQLIPLPRELASPVALAETIERTPPRVFLVLPISSATRVYGWLYVVDKLGAREFNTQDERLGVMICGQAALAYENARCAEERRRLRPERNIRQQPLSCIRLG